MVKIRSEKVAKVVADVPDLEVYGDQEGELLLIGWGGTYGHLLTTVRDMREEGYKISHAHFNYINPLPSNVSDLFSRFNKLVVAELNAGQFASYLRMSLQEFKYHQINKVQGLPFTTIELKERCKQILEAK